MAKWLQRLKDGSLPSPSVINAMVKMAGGFAPSPALAVSPLALTLDEIKGDLYGIDLALQKEILSVLRKWGKLGKNDDLPLNGKSAVLLAGSELITFNIIPTSKADAQAMNVRHLIREKEKFKVNNDFVHFHLTTL